MTLSVAGTRRDYGVSVVEVGLKLVWDVVLGMKIGAQGLAYVVDGQNKVIAHHDIGLVQRNADFSRLVEVQAARAASAGGAARSGAQVMRNIDGHEILVAFATVAPLGWLVFVELPLEEANALPQ